MLNEEQLGIAKKFEELLPWEKGELLMHIVDKIMTDDEIEKYFIEGSGFSRWKDIDYVKGVIDNNQEDEVLDRMDDWEIVDYLFGRYDSTATENLEDAMRKMLPEDIAGALIRLDENSLKDVIESFLKKYPSTFVNLVKFCIDKLAEKDE